MRNMDCPHILEYTSFCAKLAEFRNKVMKCSDCTASGELWMCLSCAELNCSRYAKGHAIQHYMNSDHHLSISVETAALYCYECDNDVEEVVHSDQLKALRNSIVVSSYIKAESSMDQHDDLLVNGEDGDDNFDHSNQSTQIIEEISNDATNKRSLRKSTRKRSYSKDENNDNSIKTTKLRIRKHSARIQQKKAIGLRNLGNTCFMNAVLQSLNNLDPFYNYIKQLPSFEKYQSSSWMNHRQLRNTSTTPKSVNEALMAEELRKILLSLNSDCQGSGRNAISPESLFLVIWKVVPKFRGYQQQDAHEFLRYMLDRLHMELLLLLPELSLKDVNIGQKGRASIVTCVFGGVLQSEVRCLNCLAVSKKQDPFLDLSLDIPDKFLSKHMSTRKSKEVGCEETPNCTIDDCLSSFIEVEELAESEQYYCNSCKKKQRSTKRFWIRRLPNVLCLHLKRFRWINYFRSKVDTEVSFPIESLDMTKFLLNDIRDTRQSGPPCNLYDLAAVVVHHGSGAGSGHYTSFAIHNGQWFHFNDSSVTSVPSDTVIKCKPYILFYIRKEIRLPKLFESSQTS